MSVVASRPQRHPPPPRAPSTGIVLAGAAALGAYEVGALSYVMERILPDVGAPPPDVLSGTSAGAINAMALASYADQPTVATRMLADVWGALELDQVLRPSSLELLSMFLDVTGAPARWRRALQVRLVRGGLLDPAPIARLVAHIPIPRVGEQIAAGLVRGVALSATRVASGEAVVFHESPGVETWQSDANIIPTATKLTASHILASAAIPLLFPLVMIDGEPYCDGGLRQLVPLSPAIHLGAERLLVINPLPASHGKLVRPPAVASPLYLAGKALNALFADRVEADLAQLRKTTAILRAGQQRFGASFERELADQLVLDGGAPLRAIDAVSIQPSQDLGLLAATFVRSRRFARRACGATGRVLRQIADGDPERAGDLLAYLLFDGAFTTDLIELGRADARAHEGEIGNLLAGVPAQTASL